MNMTIEELKAQLLAEELKELFQQSYQQGVKDAQLQAELPAILKKQDLARIFQIALPTVDKMIRMEGFPRFKHVAARYPRDEVFEWIKQNTERMNESLGVYLDFEEKKRALG